MIKKFDVFTNQFSENIFRQKYSMDGQEKWSDTCRRVVDSVCGQLLCQEDKEIIYKYILDRKFIPGGRYLYASGRPYHQINNCCSGNTRIITKNGIFSLKELENQKIEILNRFGEWEPATVKNFGKQQLNKITFKDGRVEYATPNHRWWQLDQTRVTTTDLKKVPYSKPHKEDIDPEGIRHGIIFGDGQLDTKTKKYTYIVINNKKKEELTSFFPQEIKEITAGFGAKLKIKTIRKIKAGTKISLQKAKYKKLPSGNITPSYARGFIAGLIATDGSTKTYDVTISCEGYDKALKIAELAVLGGCVVTNVSVRSIINPYNGSSRELSVVTIWRETAPLIRKDQIQDNTKKLPIRKKLCLDVVSNVPYKIEDVYCVVAPKTESFTLSTGLITSNCFLLRASDSREGWAELMSDVTACLMTGGGIGVDYSGLRAKGAKINRTGGESTGPIALMNMVNESGRYVMQGGARRSAIWAGLSWKHADIFDFMKVKDWSSNIHAVKQSDFNFPAPMEGTNISVIYDTAFFIAAENPNHELHSHAMKVWDQNCLQAFSTAEPGFSINFLKDDESLRNACVTGDTKILCKSKSGRPINRRIDKLINTKVEIWNGKEWSQVSPKITGTNQPILKITTDEGNTIKCTHYHKFILASNKNGRIQAIDLKIGDELADVKINPNGHTLHSGKIISIQDAGIAPQVYCFSESKEGCGIFNGIYTGQCTEVVSAENGDKCNLGTIWINRFKTRDDFAKCCKYATKFLMCGGIYSDVPTEKVKEVGNRNNRIGLGLGGIHEWLMIRGAGYEVTPEFHKWLNIYEMESNSAAFICAKELGVAIPKGIRAIAPTGTIGILAETTTGIEPLFCKAYKRRYLKGSEWHYEYVVDGAVKRLLELGIPMELIKDSYDISFKERVKFQADVQNYVDMSISSTCNIPPWGSETNNESTIQKNSEILLKYAKRLRGFTCYPDGARGGQPLTRMDLNEALKNEGVVFEEKEHECHGGVCGV